MKQVLVFVLACAAFIAGSLIHASAQGADKPKWQGEVDYWQPQWMQRELWGPGRMPKGMQVRLLRHWTYVNFGVPPQYKNAQSNLLRDPATLLAGGQLYQLHCASCHGKSGLGSGDGGKSLLPSPALLAYMIKRPISADEYLLWAISEGGTQFQTAMPAYKGKLSRTDIWKIIAFMRSGFAQPKSK